MSLLPPAAVQGMTDTDMFRVFGPTTVDLVFWGERFNIGALSQQAARTLPVVRDEARKPSWDPRAIPE
jgi:hypothetical protein